jgi:flagellar export protein FliJ
VNGKSNGSLITLAELKALEERAAAERLSAARERLDSERRKLTTVQRYLHEYSAERNGTGSSFGSEARALVDRQRFRLDLERSVEAQSVAVERARAQAETARAHWTGVRAEREAMEKLVAQREADAARRAVQADQRQSDEQALGRAMKAEDVPAV